MKKVAALYTVPSVYATFPNRLREAIPGVRITNTVDEFLVSDAAAKGEFTKTNLNRLHSLLRAMEMTEPDAIVVTCSTITPGVEKLRCLIGVPMVTADGAMLRKAVSMGSRIAVAHTSPTSGPAVAESLAIEEERAGKKLDVKMYPCHAAFEAVLKMDLDTHDRLVLDMVKEIKDRDVIVLGQPSMAHLEQKVRDISGIPTLSSPQLCLEELKELLNR